MAKFTRKNSIAEKLDVIIDGEIFQVEVCKLSMVELLDVTNIFHRVETRAAADPIKRIDIEGYSTILATLECYIKKVHGLKDQDDKDIVWSSLSTEARIEILEECNIDSMMALAKSILVVGRLTPDEKKDSLSTSNSQERSADVPPVQE